MTKPSTTTQTRELEPQLLPCPFCGSASTVWSEGFRRVRCNGCFIGTTSLGDHAHSPEVLAKLKAESITAWNTRASATEQVIRLREALEAVITRFQQEYRELTDGQFGTVEDFHEVKAARAALQPKAEAEDGDAG